MIARRPPWWVAAFTAAVLLLLHLPIAVLIASSFNRSRFAMRWDGFTLDWYA